MMSGQYLGELVRLLSIQLFQEKITNNKNSLFNDRNKLKGENISDLYHQYLEDKYASMLQILHNAPYHLTNFTEEDAFLLAKIIEIIIFRSADLSATLLSAVLEKAGMFSQNPQDSQGSQGSQGSLDLVTFKLDEDEIITVGVDGSVFQKTPLYASRMRNTLAWILGEEITNKTQLVHSFDGSGKGAALAAAASLNSKHHQ